MTDETEKKAAPRKAATADKRTVVQRIIDIASEVAVLEAQKSGGVPFAFRGVDAVVSHLDPLLRKHGVIVVPQGVTQMITQRDVGSKVVSKADLEVTYRFYGYEGDYIDAQVPGQADDFADRSTAQAMSVAFRILLLQTFHIPAFGNEEAASEETKNSRENAANAAVSKAATKPAPAKASQADNMRAAIVAAAGRQGITGDKLNEFAKEVTGKDVDGWWDDPTELNKILLKVNGE